MAARVAVIAIVHAGLGVVVGHESLHCKDGQVAEVGHARRKELESDFTFLRVGFRLIFQLFLAQAHTVGGGQGMFNFGHVLEKIHLAFGSSRGKTHPHHADAFLVEVLGHALKVDLTPRLALQSADNHQVAVFIETEPHATQGGVGDVFVATTRLQVARGRKHHKRSGLEALFHKLLGHHYKTVFLLETRGLEQHEAARRCGRYGPVLVAREVVEIQDAVAVFVVQGEHHRAVGDFHRQCHRLLGPFVPEGLVGAVLLVERDHDEIEGVGGFFVAVVDEEEGGKAPVAARGREFDLVGQGDEVVAGLIERAVEAGKTPQAVFLLVGLVGLVSHDSVGLAKCLEMTTLLLVPSAHLIAHRLHLLGRGEAGEEEECYEEMVFHFLGIASQEFVFGIASQEI